MTKSDPTQNVSSADVKNVVPEESGHSFPKCAMLDNPQKCTLKRVWSYLESIASYGSISSIHNIPKYIKGPEKTFSQTMEN